MIFMVVENIKLGRLHKPDERDMKFLLKSVVEPSDKTYRYWWANGWWGDQGSTPQCVAYSWTHWLEDGPVTQKGKAPIIDCKYLYDEAQKVYDEVRIEVCEPIGSRSRLKGNVIIQKVRPFKTVDYQSFHKHVTKHKSIDIFMFSGDN